jgi:TonB family protein
MVKNHVILIVLLLSTNFAHSQITDNENQRGKCDQEFHSSWIEFPIFDKSSSSESGDFGNIAEFLRVNLIYPETAKTAKVEGQVFVEFWIDTLGFTNEHKIIQSVRQDLDDEVLRVVKLIKFDEPAKVHKGGKSIGMCFTLPVTFRLSDPEFLLYKQSDKDKGKYKRKGTQSSNP